MILSLKEILNYRNVCPICQQSLYLKCETSTRYKPGVYGDNFKINYGQSDKVARYINFYNDGTYKPSSLYDANPNYLSEIIFRKYCKKCSVKGHTGDTAAGTTILNRISKKGYYYSFRCKIENGSYKPEILREYFSLMKESLFIIDNHFLENKLFLEKIKAIDSRWKMQVEAKKLDHYKDGDHLIKMVVDYITFS